LAAYDGPPFKTAVQACIAAAWYCSVLAVFGTRDAETLTNELDGGVKREAEPQEREIFEGVFNSALRAAAHSVRTSAVKGIPTPAFGIADELLSVLMVIENVSAPVDTQLREEFISRFCHPFSSPNGCARRAQDEIRPGREMILPPRGNRHAD